MSKSLGQSSCVLVLLASSVLIATLCISQCSGRKEKLLLKDLTKALNDDEKLAKDIVKYLDLVPISRRSKSDVDAILGKGNKHSKSLQTQLDGLDIKYGILKAILEKLIKPFKEKLCDKDDEECKCNKPDCNCPKEPNCDKCPPCALPADCPYPEPGEVCPPILPCTPCKPSTSDNSTTTTGKPEISSTTSAPSSSTTSTTSAPTSTQSPSTSTSTSSPTSTTQEPGKSTTTARPSEASRSSSGVTKFESLLESSFKNTSTYNHLKNLIDDIPETVGGEEMRLADKILAQFGEPRAPIFKVGSGSQRAFTYYSANYNARCILGHILRKIKQKCKCEPCADLCKCPPLKECKTKAEKPENCKPCPRPKECPQPSKCPKSPKCACGRESSGSSNRASPKANQASQRKFSLTASSAVDPLNPLTGNELWERKVCQGFTCTWQKNCGVAPLNSLTPRNSQSGYIVNGEAQTYGEWPFYVRLTLHTPGSSTQSLCGGVLITDQHVLTAGHCVVSDGAGKPFKRYYSPKEITVTLGEHTRSTVDSHEVNLKAKSVCTTKRYDDLSDGTRYDYSVITLEKPVKMNDYISHACLPYEYVDPFKSKCYVVGLGVTKYVGDQPIYSEKVQKMRITQTSCKVWGFRDNDRSRHCFTKAFSAGDTCGGDSGGPIICLNRHKRWSVVGLVSYGSTMCDGTDRVGWIGVYTRVTALMGYMRTDCGI